jgi:hypothetical protein
MVRRGTNDQMRHNPDAPATAHTHSHAPAQDLRGRLWRLPLVLALAGDGGRLLGKDVVPQAIAARDDNVTRLQRQLKALSLVTARHMQRDEHS